LAGTPWSELLLGMCSPTPQDQANRIRGTAIPRARLSLKQPNDDCRVKDS
jgi:hypothetical protein